MTGKKKEKRNKGRIQIQFPEEFKIKPIRRSLSYCKRTVPIASDQSPENLAQACTGCDNLSWEINLSNVTLNWCPACKSSLYFEHFRFLQLTWQQALRLFTNKKQISCDKEGKQQIWSVISLLTEVELLNTKQWDRNFNYLWFFF